MKNQGLELGVVVAGSVKNSGQPPTGPQVRDIAAGSCQKVVLRID